MPPKAQYHGTVQKRAMVPPMNTNGDSKNLLPKQTVLLKALSFSRDFITNAVLWLTDSEGLIALREKTVTLRLLNDQRAHDKRLQVQLVSTILPIVLLALIGGTVFVIRKRKYERV